MYMDQDVRASFRSPLTPFEGASAHHVNSLCNVPRADFFCPTPSIYTLHGTGKEYDMLCTQFPLFSNDNF